MSFWKLKKGTQTGDILLQGSCIRSLIGAGGLGGAFWEMITKDQSRIQNKGQDKSLFSYSGLKSMEFSMSTLPHSFFMVKSTWKSLP